MHQLSVISGFEHSAFVLRAEGQLDQTPLSKLHITRGGLVELLSKALLYAEAEAHWRGTTVTTNCKAPFSILSRHVCSSDPNLPATYSFEPPPIPPEPIPPYPNSGGPEKRKADAAAGETSRKDKRARTEDMMDLDSVASSAPREYLVLSTLKYLRSCILCTSCLNRSATKASTPLPSTPAEPSQSSSRKTGSASVDRSEVATQKDPVDFLEGHKTEVQVYLRRYSPLSNDVPQVFLCSWHPTSTTILASGCAIF